MYSAEVVQEGLQRRQQPWRWGAQWLAIRCWQQPNESNHWSWSSYNYRKSCQRTQHRQFYGHWHLKRIGKVEKLHQQVSRELTENQNNHYLKRLSSLILCNSNEPFLNRIVICNKKWILYNNLRWPAQLLDLQEAPKHFPKPNLHQKRSLFGGLLLVWFTTASWILEKPLHLRSMLCKPVRRTENGNTCSCIGQQKGPSSSPGQCLTACHTASASKT